MKLKDKVALVTGTSPNIGGGLWACPPGVSGPGDWFGEALFN